MMLGLMMSGMTKVISDLTARALVMVTMTLLGVITFLMMPTKHV
jgi:hypothetical protein